MKPNAIYTLFTLATLASATAPTWAQNSEPAPSASAKAPIPKENALEGEVRLDGKITVILGSGQWVVQSVSWTSPRGVVTNFDDPKNKNVVLAPDAYLHPHFEADKVALADVKVGARVAVIGKNQPGGSLKVREVVLLEGYGSRRMVGVLVTNGESMRLVNQARELRNTGQTAKALQLVTRAIEIAQGLGDTSGEALATNDLALLYNENEEPEKAMQAFMRCETLGRTLSNPMVLTLAMNGRASLLLSADQLDAALQVLQTAEPISQSAPAAVRMSTLRLLAFVYLDLDQLSGGIGVLERLYPLQAENGQADQALETQLNLAFLRAGDDPDAAKAIIAAVTPRLAGINEDKTRADAIGTLGAALWRLGDQDGARQQFDQATKILDDAGKKGAERWRNMATNLAAAPDNWLVQWVALQGGTIKPPQGNGAPLRRPDRTT